MRLSAPKMGTFLICLVVGVLTIIAHFVSIPVIGSFLNSNSFWFLGGSFVLLLLSTILKGL